MNERKTEQLVRQHLEALGYNAPSVIVEEQSSDNKQIRGLLKGASKHDGGGIGSPEFLITSGLLPDFVVVYECKADPKFHESANLDKPKDFAVDGALHYAKHLAAKFNVVAIGASGTTEKDFKSSAWLVVKGAKEAKPLRDYAGAQSNGLLPVPQLYQLATLDDGLERVRFRDLLAFAKKLHNFMRKAVKANNREKPLLVSGILIALKNEAFRAVYDKYSADELPGKMCEAISDTLKRSSVPVAKAARVSVAFTSLAAELHDNLAKPEKKGSAHSTLRHLIDEIKDNVFPYVAAHTRLDIVGSFYGEFLRYSSGDAKEKGIVLTPRHVTELFCDLADVDEHSVVLDTCCGTGGYLIAAMHRMFSMAGTDAQREHIREHQLIGVEDSPTLFALAASNMILRGDGKANLFPGSCFDPANASAVKNLKPTVGLINPPYSLKGEGESELDFIDHMLDCLQPNGTGVAIIPLGCVISDSKVKERLLSKHSLDAVISMPERLFYPVATTTVVLVFTAHKPHKANKKTWLKMLKDDGLVQTKAEGRSDYYGRWPGIRKQLLDSFACRKEELGVSMNVALSADDEWCAEAFIETDYTKLTKEDFERTLKRYFLFKRKTEKGDIDNLDEQIAEEMLDEAA